MENKSNMGKLFDTMNEVVINLTKILNELDGEVNKKIEDLRDNNG